ncbi:MAG: hypothetical protein AAGA76_09280 [Pseudomonadota bacterium]
MTGFGGKPVSLMWSMVSAAAFGIPCEDYGQRVEAVVKLCDDSNINTNDLLELCRGKLGAFKTPDHIHLLTDLPKGPSGKIQRIKLAEIVS